ncbi:helix-turn-helix domain-containing protein [Reyranella sp. CPCC 100927]|uniref:helix-turn-helix domain-containing protein n=1 Tax=Reyranella sp. CPCC 100927 TaxID=2599616 RepID=UPI0011B363BC|nr:helix-turn-helix transcriptional regulator [Reyranella sp. CPCC 100927]TWT15485.1 helix-turn-helix transcriptional regulator [Reyranella sp. CPCC 100927]
MSIASDISSGAERAPFGLLLRDWRRRRGASQLELSLRSGVSQRHVSFLESGRARPSREMVVHLAVSLDVPLRHQNQLLLAAGFAPVYRQSNLEAPEMADVRQAIDHILNHQEPYPAIVIDRLFNILLANTATSRLIGFLMGPAAAAIDGPINLLRATLAPQGLRPYIANWPEVAHYLITRTAAELALNGLDADAKAFLDELSGYPDMPTSWRDARPDDTVSPILPLHFHKDGKDIRVMTTISTLGTPQDVTLQEMRIETFFPVDAASTAFFKQLAKG